MASSRALLTDDVKVRNTSGSVRAFPSFDESLLIPTDYNKNRVHTIKNKNNDGTLCCKMLVQAMTVYVNSHVGVFRSKIPPPPHPQLIGHVQSSGAVSAGARTGLLARWGKKRKQMVRGAKQFSYPLGYMYSELSGESILCLHVMFRNLLG